MSNDRSEQDHRGEHGGGINRRDALLSGTALLTGTALSEIRSRAW